MATVEPNPENLHYVTCEKCDRQLIAALDVVAQTFYGVCHHCNLLTELTWAQAETSLARRPAPGGVN